MRQCLILLSALMILVSSALTVWADPVSSDIGTFSVLAANSVELKDRAQVDSGNVGVLEAASGPWLSPRGQAAFGHEARTADGTAVYADSIYLKQRASVFDIGYNTLDSKGKIRGRQIHPLALPLAVTLPLFPDPVPGNENIRVSHSDTLVLEPGGYGTIRLHDRSTLILTGGIYHLRELRFSSNDIDVFFRAPSDLIISEGMDTGHRGFIGPEPGADLTAAGIRIYVSESRRGNGNHNPHARQVVRIGHDTRVEATVYAPGGTITVQDRGEVAGALIGRDILLGHNVRISLDSGFRPPRVWTDQPSYMVPENETLTFTVKARDPLGGVPEITASDLPPGADLTADGTFTWTPNYEHAGDYTLVFSANDYRGLTGSVQVAVTVENVNRPPVATVTPDSYTVPENQPLSFQVDGSDPDGDPVVFSAGNLPAGADFAPDTRTFIWTPTYDQAGDYTLEFTAADPGELTGTAEVTVTVTNVNRPPTLSADPAEYSVLENEALSVRFVAGDPDGNALRFSTEGLPRGAGFNAETRTLAWTPDYDQAGVYTVTITAADPEGLQARASVTLTVIHVNRPPVVVADPAAHTIPENQPITFQVTGQDPDGDPVTLSADGLPEGAVFDPATGIFTWTPTFEQSGEYTPVFTAADPDGLTDAVTVPLTVTHVNRPPEVLADPAAYTVSENESLSFSVAGQDPDGDPVTLSARGLPAGAGFDPETGVFDWTPGYDQSGEYTLIVTAADPDGLTGTREILLGVANVNRPPVLDPISELSFEEDILGTHGLTAADPDGDRLTYTLIQGPEGMALAPDGTLTWAPRADQVGSHELTVEIDDGLGGTHRRTGTAPVTAGQDRTPPAVTLLVPAQSRTGTVLTVEVEARDDTGVTGVGIHIDGLLIREYTFEPYVLTYNTPNRPRSRLTVRAVAVDAAGNAGEAEASVLITDQADTAAPVIHALILPPSASPGETVTLGASVTDDRQVGEVRFTLSGAELGAAFLEPWEVSFQVPAEAVEGDLLSIQAEAVDTSGNAATAEGTITVAAAADTEPPAGVVLDGPAEAIAGRTLTLTAAATDDTGILKVTFFADGVEIAADAEAPYQAVYNVPASHIVGTPIRFTARAADFAGNTADSDPLLTRIVAPGAGEIAGRVYEDTSGLPVENAAVALVSVHGEPPADIMEVYTDAWGMYRIPAPQGAVVLRIDAPNTIAAWRTVSVRPDRVTPAYDARLTPLAGGVLVYHLSGADLQYDALGADLEVPAGAFGEDVALTLTRLSEQGLPGSLPVGWRPVSALHIGPDAHPLNTPLILRLWGSDHLDDPDTAPVPVLWDPDETVWRRIPSDFTGTEITLYPAHTGALALVRPDTRPSAPPVPAVGQALTGTATAALPADAAAEILPDPDILFMQPGVRSDVRAVLTGSEPLPSGIRISVDITEYYDHLDGTRTSPPPMTQEIVLYRRWDGLAGRFFVSPSLTFDPAQLAQGLIRLAARRPDEAPASAKIGPDGGTLPLASGLSVRFPAGVLAGDTLVSLETLESLPAALTGDPRFTVTGETAGILIDLGVAAPAPGAVLETALSAAPAADDIFLLVRPVTLNSRTQYELVSAASVDGTTLRFDGAGLGLSGIGKTGRYFILKLSDPAGFVVGILTDGIGPVAGGIAETESLPFISRTGADGRYVLAAPPGETAVRGWNPATGESASGTADLTAAGEVVTLDLFLAAVRPGVVSITPEDGAAGVPLTTAVTAVFSEALDPDTLTGAHFQVLAGGSPIPSAVTPLSGGRSAAFRPAAPLTDSAVYTIEITYGVTDIYGNALIPFTSVFSTVDTTPPLRPEAGQITVPIPDDTGTTTVTATQGTVEPGTRVSVIVIQDGTAVRTSVTAEDDGSFTATVDANLTDKLTLDFMDDAGNITAYDPGPFRDADGTTVIGEAGGDLRGVDPDTGDWDSSEIIVPEGAVPDATAIKVNAKTEARLPLPVDPYFDCLGVLELEMGEVIAEEELKASIQAPEGIALTEDSQILVFQVVDFFGHPEFTLVNIAYLKETETGTRLETASPPFCGLLMSGLYAFATPAPYSEPVTFGTIIPSAWLGSARLMSKAGFKLVYHPKLPGYFTIIAVPANRNFDVTVYDEDGSDIVNKTYDAPTEPFDHILIPAQEDIDGVPDVYEVEVGSDLGTTPVMENVPATGIAVNSDAAVTFTKQVTGVTEDNLVLESVNPDGSFTPVSGTVQEKRTPVNGKDILQGAVFSPDTRLKYGTEYQLKIQGLKDFNGQQMPAAVVRTFKTFRPKAVGSIDVPYPADVSFLGTDPKKPRLAVASGALYDPEPNQHGIVLLDVTDPSSPVFMREEAIAADTFGLLAIDNAAVKDGLLSGPAVLGISGGVQEFSSLRLYRITGENLDGFDLAGFKFLSMPAQHIAEGYTQTGVPRQSGIPESIFLNGGNDAYISTIGIGVLGVHLDEAISQHQGNTINELPGKYLMNSVVATAVANGVLLAGDMNHLQVVSADLSTEHAAFEIPARSVAAGDRFPVGFDENGNAVLKDLAFVGATDGGLTVLDMDTPENPVILSRIQLAGAIRSIRPDFDNRLLYASSNQNLYAIDLEQIGEGGNDRDRVLGTVDGLSGAGKFDIRNGIGYVADNGHGKVHAFILGCPDRSLYIKEGEYPVPPGGSVTLMTAPKMEVTWEIIEYTDGLNEKNVSINEETGVLSVGESAVPGFVRVRAVNKDINGCDIEAVVRVCDCGCINCTGKAEVNLGSADIRINLGPAAGGHAAGELLIRAGSVSDVLADPAAVKHSILARDVDVVYSEDGTIESIDTGRNQVSLVPDADGYDIRFKGPEGSFVTYKAQMTGLDGDRRFRFSEYRDWDLVRSVEYGASPDGGMRMLRLDETETAVQEEILQKSTDGDLETQVRTVLEDGLPVSVTEMVFETTETGSRVISETVDPDGVNLTTLSEYFTNPGDPGFGRLKTRARPDGSSVTYTYDALGRVVTESRYFMDTPGARVTAYDYTPLAGDSDRAEDIRIPRTVTETIDGVVVSKSFAVYRYAADGERTEITERAASAGAGYGDAANLRTVRIYHPYGRTFTSGRLKSVTYPDGRKDTYTYEQGAYTESADSSLAGGFIPGAGDDVRASVVYGTEARPKGVPYKTTKEVTITDRTGHTLQEESYVYTGMGYERIRWTVRVLDDQGRPETEYRSDGTMTENIWGCCSREQTTDAQGLTVFFAYDGLDRLTSEAQESLKGMIRTDYDRTVTETGRIETRTVTGGGLSLSSVTRYDQAGRMVSVTDEAGLTTRYEYTEAGRITIVIHPGGATEITERYLDGRTRRVTGTAVTDRFYEYGVNTQDNTQWTKVYTGNADASSPMWEKTVTDPLGRTIRTETPAFGSRTEITANEYDEKGRLVRTSTPGQADTLYEYDELGNQIRTGLDVDGSGSLEPASADRITDADSAYTRIGTAWWQQSVQTVYAETGDGTATPAGTQRTRITGLGVSGEYGILTGESISVDSHGNQATQKSFLDRADSIATQVVDYPDSEIDAVLVSEKGLPVSSTGKTGITVIYDYDTLARRTHVIDPRTGAAVTAYNDKGQVESVTDPAQNTTEFLYDLTTGRKIAERNALNQYIRYAYDDRGQVTRTWGDTAYPVKYVYDEIGRMTEMHTFREGENWSGETWPSAAEAAADITRWNYDAATGLLTAKEYADGTRTRYGYETSGRLDTRTWARTVEGAPLVTDYDYDAATGELTGIDYSDAGTADITFAYDRLGRRETVTDSVGIRTFAYNENLQLESENIAGGGLYGPDPVVLKRTYEDGTDGTDGSGVPGRNNGFTLGAGYAVTYGYDAETGRFSGLDWTAGSKNGSVNYGYVENSELLGSVTSGNIATTYSYEPHRNLKTRVENAFNPSVISAYEYRYDELGRRTSVVNTGIAFESANRTGFNKYGYNDRSEVTESRRYEGTDSEHTGMPVDPETRLYGYDPIGNREQATEGTAGSIFYATNALNQYTRLTGAVNADPGYDPDGNMTAYDGKEYAWNGENRLVSVTPLIPVEGDQKVAFVYDYQGRRVRKSVYAYGAGEWQPEKEILFVYDGWNLVHEKEVAPAGDTLFDKFYVWGLDLSQTLQGAGGIGGLVCRVANGEVRHYFYDGNGNVGQMVDPEDGTATARYEYDPFGNTIAMDGTDAQGNGFQFSTKFWDNESWLYYYGFRYYLSELGRLVSRDPVGEQGGKNIYSFVWNNSVNYSDFLGLALYAFDGTGTDENTFTHIRMLYESYTELKEYEEGVGSRWYSGILGGITGFGGGLRLETMYRKLVHHYENGDRNIDIIGFSRGAALAREFANMIHERGIVKTSSSYGYIEEGRNRKVHKIERIIDCSPVIRFVGIFDTVGSFGIPGNSINLGIRMDLPPNVLHAAHAVSRHEHRSEFPSTQLNYPNPGQHFIQEVFDGDHSDIGGGHMHEQNLLAIEPLSFIWRVGRSIGVPFGKIPFDKRERIYGPYARSVEPHDLTPDWKYRSGPPRESLRSFDMDLL